jgi:hypothetical protein
MRPILLEPITDMKRRRERELLKVFEQERPAILGALLKAVSRGLRRLPNMKLEAGPRLADFFDWAIACGDGYLWKKGEFAKVYTLNRAGVVADVVEADPVADAVHNLMKVRHENGETEPWKGTATNLWDRLGLLVQERVMNSKKWPGSASALSGRLRSIATPLRRLGIEIGHDRTSGSRSIIITAVDAKVRISPSSASSPSSPSSGSHRNKQEKQ